MGTQHGPRLKRHGKVIRADDAACWQSGQRYIEQAKKTAEAILEEAREHARQEEIRGYTTGLERARREQVNLMTEMIARRDAYLASIESQLAGVVVNAVRKIFAEFSDEQRANIVVTKALKQMRGQAQATIRINPSQYEAVRASIDDLLKTCADLEILNVESDSRVAGGACVLSCDIGVVETDLETQLRAIENSLLRRISASTD